MRSRYRKTWAGFLWVIAGPILTFLVQSLIFQEIFKFKIEKYPVYLIAGLLPWFFISQALCSVTSCLVISREVLLAFKIRPIVIVASQVLDQFLSFLAAFIVIGVFIILPDIEKYSFLRLGSLILSMISLFYFVFILCSILSFWHVFYRDVLFVTQFLMGLVFYITPIFYSANSFPPKFIWLLDYNFFIPFVKIFQISIYSWNAHEWLGIFGIVMVLNAVMTLLLFLSLKFKMRDFYINL